MMIIILLGAITRLAMVSADCDIDNIGRNNQPVSHSGRTNLTGTWFWLYYMSQEEGNANVDCPVTYFEMFKENLARMKTHVYVKSTGTRHQLNGTAVDWNTNGYYDFYYTEPSGETTCPAGETCKNISHHARTWSERAQDLSNGHGRYIILKACRSRLGTPIIHIAFRTPNPDEGTLDNVKRDLKLNGLHFNQFAKWETNHC